MEFPPYVVIVRFYFYLYVEHGYIGCTDASDTNKDYATDTRRENLEIKYSSHREKFISKNMPLILIHDSPPRLMK